MDQFVEGRNPYDILGLEKSQKITVDEIKKAYRRLALIKHPDKAKTPNAAQEFDELKKAYAILSDKSARGALDDYLEAQAHREKRLAQQDVKRQRLREELEKKEKESDRTRSEEEQARARLKVELEALRTRAQQEQQQKQQQQRAAAAAAASSRASSSAGAGPSGRATAVPSDGEDDETTQLLQRTVKVSWDPTVGNYSTERLRELFSTNHLVEDVILKDSRKRKKASALVVLDSIQAACQAAQEVHGDLKNPLLVTPYLKVMPHEEQQQGQQQQQAGVHGSSRHATAGEPSNQAAAPVFAAGVAGSGSSKPSQRPSKPLFPGAQPRAMPAPAEAAVDAPGAADAAATNPAGATKAFSSFPGMPTASGAKPKPFSSFPGMPAGGFEQSVLQKLSQKPKQT